MYGSSNPFIAAAEYFSSSKRRDIQRSSDLERAYVTPAYHRSSETAVPKALPVTIREEVFTPPSSYPRKMLRYASKRKYSAKRKRSSATSGKYAIKRTQTITRPVAKVEIKSKDFFKNFDAASTGVLGSTFVFATNGLFSIPGGGVGGSGVTRLGDQIKCMDIRFAGYIIKNQNVFAYDLVRLIFFEWFKDGVTYSTTDIVNQDNIMGAYDQVGARKFQILFDKTYKIGPAAHAGAGVLYSDVLVPLKGVIRCARTVNFTDTLGTSGDRNVYCMAVAANSTSGTNINLSLQTRFYDV